MNALDKFLNHPVYVGKQPYTGHGGFGHNWAQRAAVHRANQHVGEPMYLPLWMILLGIVIALGALWFFCAVASQPVYLPM